MIPHKKVGVRKFDNICHIDVEKIERTRDVQI